MDRLWLPNGIHHGLHIDHFPTGRGGTLVTAGRKHLLHTTQGNSFEGDHNTLMVKRAEPNFLFGHDGRNWRVRQYIPLNQGSRALEHPSGTLDTNNAGCVQYEISGHAVGRGDGDWSDEMYDNLAKLMLMVERRVKIERKHPRKFTVIPNRYTPRGFVNAKGIFGHQHAASQPEDHWDPGAIRAYYLVRRMNHHAHEIIR